MLLKERCLNSGRLGRYPTQQQLRILELNIPSRGNEANNTLTLYITGNEYLSDVINSLVLIFDNQSTQTKVLITDDIQISPRNRSFSISNMLLGTKLIYVLNKEIHYITKEIMQITIRKKQSVKN